MSGKTFTVEVDDAASRANLEKSYGYRITGARDADEAIGAVKRVHEGDDVEVVRWFEGEPLSPPANHKPLTGFINPINL